MTRLSIVVPSKTISNLLPCVEALKQHEPQARIIIVDDGIHKADLACLQVFGCDCVDGPQPFVFARNVNLGIQAAGADDVAISNDDAVLKTPGGLTAMQRILEQYPHLGLLSATTNVAGNLALRPQSGNSIFRVEPRTVNFVCVLIPRRTIEAVGLLDERFTGYGGDDDDYCLRVRKAGLTLGIFDGCYVDHGSLRSTFRGSPTAPGDYSANHELFKQKWGQDIWGNPICQSA